ncbi:hypothetical protein [Bradyrhizobium sp.]|jgi:hypothetical protein|uniref:hypothetical protein n=1 Tax=Bradyrhizobium sp. TaxID=376 RepID=UPI003C188A40
MAKIDLDSLNIEELAALRDAATEKLAQKVMVRQAELEAELESLSQYGKLAKKALVAPQVGKPKKGDDPARKIDEAKDAVAKNVVAKDAVAKDAVAKAA